MASDAAAAELIKDSLRTACAGCDGYMCREILHEAFLGLGYSMWHLQGNVCVKEYQDFSLTSVY